MDRLPWYEMTPRERFLWYAAHFIGTPYKWGGDDPMAGYDCSGYVIECLQGVGLFPRGQDSTAQNLFYNVFRGNHVPKPDAGCLVFWGNRRTNQIIHVEICLTDKLSLGASGGGARTKTIQDAIMQNAFIKMRAFRERSGIAGYVDPFKA